MTEVQSLEMRESRVELVERKRESDFMSNPIRTTAEGKIQGRGGRKKLDGLWDRLRDTLRPLVFLSSLRVE